MDEIWLCMNTKDAPDLKDGADWAAEVNQVWHLRRT